MYEQIGLLKISSEKPGKSSPEQNRHIYNKILQNTSSSIQSARTSKTNSKTPYEISILQKHDKNPSIPTETQTEKEFKSLYASNQLTSSIDLKGVNALKTIQEGSNNGLSNDNSRNMRKSLENLNAYTKGKALDRGDKYTELKQSIMNQIKMQNFKDVDEKTSSRENSKQHGSGNPIANHKSALNYFSLNQNNKNIKTGNNAINNSSSGFSDKPTTITSTKVFKKMAGQFENSGSPDKKSIGNKGNQNSLKKEKKPLDNNNSMNQNSSHLHSNKSNAKLADKYFEVLEKSNKKLNLNKASSYSSKDVASHSFQNPNKSKTAENLNISDNSQVSASNANNCKGSEITNNEYNTNYNYNSTGGSNLFDFTLLKSYNEKMFKQQNSNESGQEYERGNLKKKEARDITPKKRELAKSLPATTKNSSTLNFKSNLNEMVLNNKAYNLLKTRRDELTNYQSLLKGPSISALSNPPQNPNVKVNDLLNEEFKNNSEKLVKFEKERCEECEIKSAELETIYEKVKILFDIHRKKEATWKSEKAHFVKQIEYLNTVIRELIEKNSS